MKYKLIFADAIEYAFDELIIPNRPIGYLNFIRQQIITDGYVKHLISYVNGLYYNYDSKHEMFKKRNITKDKFDLKYCNFMSILNLSLNDYHLDGIFTTKHDDNYYDYIAIRSIPNTIPPTLLNTYTGNAIIDYTDSECLNEYKNVEKLLGIK